MRGERSGALAPADLRFPGHARHRRKPTPFRALLDTEMTILRLPSSCRSGKAQKKTELGETHGGSRQRGGGYRDGGGAAGDHGRQSSGRQRSQHTWYERGDGRCSVQAGAIPMGGQRSARGHVRRKTASLGTATHMSGVTVLVTSTVTCPRVRVMMLRTGWTGSGQPNVAFPPCGAAASARFAQVTSSPQFQAEWSRMCWGPS